MKTILRMLGMMTMTLVCCHARAVEPAPVDSPALYSHAMPVQFQGSGGLLQLRLPKEVYLQARSPALHDLRLFDGQGRRVPFALTMPLVQRSAGQPPKPARVFALEADDAAAAAKLAIRTSPDGTLLSVETQAPGRPTGASLAGLLLDLGPAATGQEMISALVFTAPPGAANYSARLHIEESDDLQEWSYVADAKLDWLSNGANDTIANNRIAFDARPLRYVRLSWREGKPRMFAAIAAERAPVETTAYAPYSLLVSPQAGVVPGDLVYPVGRAIPLRSIGLPLDRTGTIMTSDVGRYMELPAVRASAAAQGAGRWQFDALLRTTFYKIAQADGTVRTPPDVSIGPLSVDRLVVRPLQAVDIKPSLRIGWMPATMIFAARDAAPYTLAMGKEDAPSVQAPLSEVAPGYRESELLATPAATAGALRVQHTAGQEASLAQRAGLSATARTAVLWGVLLLGVLVLAILCWRMVKQLRGEEAARERPDAAP